MCQCTSVPPGARLHQNEDVERVIVFAESPKQRGVRALALATQEEQHCSGKHAPHKKICESSRPVAPRLISTSAG